jgi:hypothetical protein
MKRMRWSLAPGSIRMKAFCKNVRFGARSHVTGTPHAPKLPDSNWKH